MLNPLKMNSLTLSNGRFIWLKNAWIWLKRQFDFSKPSDAPLEHQAKSDGKSVNQADQIEALTKHFDFEPNVFPEMSDDLRTQIKGIMNGSWGLGYEDGSIGQRQMTREFFRAQAEQVRDQYLYFLKGKSIPAQTQAEELKERFNRTSEVLEQAQDYRNDSITRRQLYPRQYSHSLAFIYILVAGLLLLADIPLALMVTQLIFDLAPPDKYHDITYLLYRPTDDVCNGLFSHFWKVVTGNWQVTIMTVGVALCAIYFKIFYDDSMGYSVDKSIRQFRLLSLHNQFKNASKEEVKKEEKKIRYLYYIRVGVKFLILIFTLFTIIHLGRVRAAAESLQDAFTYQSSTTVEPGAEVTTVLPAVDDTIIKRKEELNDLKKWMFIWLTILLPLIAGICFSLGMGNVHNRQESRYAEKLYWKKVDEHTKALAAHKEAQMHASTYESFIAKCESDSFVQNYEISFYHCYLHGYQRGVVSPDKDRDLYERALKFRDRLVATKSNEAIQRANERILPVNPFTKN
jgi:Mor family transcriptional regulator